MVESLFTLVISIAILAGVGCLWGYAVNAVVQNKGYDENWFWWGFFFGMIALLIALAKPEAQRFSSASAGYSHPESAAPPSSAGKSYSLMSEEEKRFRRETLAKGGWECRKCHRTNPAYVGTCVCGNSRYETPPPAENQEDPPKAPELAEADQKELADLAKLKAYKELLDCGAITQDEYDLKKQELWHP